MEITPDHPAYDTERAGFQTAFEQRPAVIIAARTAEDVRAAVALAPDRDLAISVEATGHGRAGVTEGHLLISTRAMTGVRVDAERCTAWIEAGAQWRHVIDAAAPHGLAPLSGSAPEVGAIGYTLGGGIGLLAREFGYAADHVGVIELVTADARMVRVTADSEPDLFWALRGARDGFGVVTGIEVDLVPVSTIYGGGLYFDLDRVPDAVSGYLAWSATVPEQLTSSVGVYSMPDLPMFPEPLRGRYVAHVRIAYTGEDGDRLVAPLRELGPRVIDKLGELPFSEAGSIYNDPTQPHGYLGDNVLLTELDANALRDVLTLAGQYIVDIRHLGGALAREPEVPNAVGHRAAQYILRLIAPLDGTDPETVHSGLQKVFDVVRPWTIGSSLNFVYGTPAKDAHEPCDLLRLRDLRARINQVA
ncbi:FAD-binding oxidoreductase [Allokutzneria sp. A3M-2-11 16]|uniref:FAD-binding oxidoreductase n=1 Tax=Allokutzneria sp. A3M-2-11 16 TaxID=2962043 RepID=UPI0020B83315|nr:FAD-binding oxidoreductase [Allokutzneria sp. A3M-2-11 16]MCP3804029.1 FAD-binding oxidoreductase [Allokutzneria sp. A3M-2-11 16]